MASKKGEFFTGIIGNMVYRVMNGKQVVSSRVEPGTMKQTKATKTASGNFAAATALAAQLRRTLAIQLEGLYGDPMRNRLNGLFNKILTESRDPISKRFEFNTESFSRLAGFEFDLDSKVTDHALQMPVLDRLAERIDISFSGHQDPGMFKFPKRSLRCKLTFTLSLFRLKQGKMIALAESQSILLSKNEYLQQPAILTFNVPDGCLYVVGMFLEYQGAGKAGWRVINNLMFSPGCICIAGITAGKETGNSTGVWKKMDKLK
jgi:hypothetical protein